MLLKVKTILRQEIVVIGNIFRYPQTTYGKGSTSENDCEGPGLVVTAGKGENIDFIRFTDKHFILGHSVNSFFNIY